MPLSAVDVFALDSLTFIWDEKKKKMNVEEALLRELRKRIQIRKINSQGLQKHNHKMKTENKEREG